MWLGSPLTYIYLWLPIKAHAGLQAPSVSNTVTHLKAYTSQSLYSSMLVSHLPEFILSSQWQGFPPALQSHYAFSMLCPLLFSPLGDRWPCSVCGPCPVYFIYFSALDSSRCLSLFSLLTHNKNLPTNNGVVMLAVSLPYFTIPCIRCPLDYLFMKECDDTLTLLNLQSLGLEIGASSLKECKWS